MYLYRVENKKLIKKQEIMKTKIFMAIASFFTSAQCVRPMFYEEPNYDMWWMAIVFFLLGVGLWVNRKTKL